MSSLGVTMQPMTPCVPHLEKYRVMFISCIFRHCFLRFILKDVTNKACIKITIVLSIHKLLLQVCFKKYMFFKML